MPPIHSDFIDIFAIPVAVFIWWRIAEMLFTGIEQRRHSHKRLATNERLFVGYFWPILLIIGAITIFARSLNNR